MTIVACWLDKSFGVTSLSALADARASEEINGTWYTHSDNTIKLFAIEVRCFELDSLVPGLGTHIDPYFETTIGLGFAGHCFEALTIIAHIQRAMGALCRVDRQAMLPEPDGLLNLAAVIAEKYMRDHAYGSIRSFEMLVFGWNGPDLPWIGKVVWNKEDRKITKRMENPTPSSIVTIGDGATASRAIGVATRLRSKIARRLGIVASAPPSEKNTFSEALLAIEASRRIAEGVGNLIENQFVQTVGGVRQKLQIAWHGDRARAAFTLDDQSQLMDGLPSVNRSAFLGPIPIVEKMS